MDSEDLGARFSRLLNGLVINLMAYVEAIKVRFLSTSVTETVGGGGGRRFACIVSKSLESQLLINDTPKVNKNLRQLFCAFIAPFDTNAIHIPNGKLRPKGFNKLNFAISVGLP